MGIQFSTKIHWTINMYRLLALLFVGAVSAVPVMEDTAEVKAAKAEFNAAFDMAVKGEHANLAPVNNDVQAEQIPMSYMADTADVASAKAEFMAAFDDAKMGGLAAKQAPAPVHMVATAPVAHHVMPVSYAVNSVHQAAVNPYMAYPHVAYPYTYGAFPYMHHYGYTYGMPYYSMPMVAAAAAVPEVSAEKEVMSE